MSEKKAPLSEHIKELRRALIISSSAVALATLVIFGVLREPLMQFLISPSMTLGIRLHFTGVSEAFMAYMKVSVLAGLIVASPIVLWQVLRFVLPGLYRNERKRFLLLLFFSTLLFVGGVAFGYYFAFKMALQLLIHDFGQFLQPMLTVSNYLGFAAKFLLPFGLVFEMPLLVYFLAAGGVITPKQLSANRKYVLIGILIVAAVLTPPDVVSQIMLTIPMTALYEISIWIAKWVYKRKHKKEQADD